ncbi:FtsQ-type POTRA domain-containing protein [Pelagibacteraceae bacterium]|nr:FtsQ-type POTRA domain-containing protein [Pelagibacteraceae bacterium]
MKRSKKTFVLIIIFFLISSFNPNFKEDNKSFIFPIKIIFVENNKIVNTNDIQNKLSSLKGKNLLFINHELIKSKIKKYDFIQSFRLKKIYPKTLKIIIIEKNPVAIYMDGKNKYYLSDIGDVIKYKQLKDINDLPKVFGSNNGFEELYKNLKKLDFPINEIKHYHYFKIDRWDIILKNDKTIKLSNNNYVLNLKNFMEIKDKKNFEKYQIFDYRIKNQLILN